MVTIVRAGSLRVVIHCDDHDPPHVHVMGDGETKIELGNSPETIKVLYSANTKTSERRRAIRAVSDNHALLLERWSKLHG